MMSSTLIGWYRGCADSTRFDTVSLLIGTGGFCARVASWRDFWWGPAGVNRHGACASESNEGFNPEGITIVKMLCWSKQCQSLVKPHTPSSSLFHNAFQGVLLIKHFSWRRINYTVELLNRISHTNLLDERPTSPPCNSSPLVHRGSIEKRQTRHEVLVMCLGLH